MRTAIHDDIFTPDVIADPYAYYGRLRDEAPVFGRWDCPTW
jgi:hypothetical protein